MIGKAFVVVPCFDEAHRLRPEPFLELARAASVLFVDDGSTDDTPGVLSAIRAKAPAAVSVLRLERNRGKGEAVRRGLLTALDAGAELAGFLDADLSTPIDEMERLIARARDPGVSAVLASRIAILGAHIDRSKVRHYFGRVFATGASMVLRIAVYDTQCGAKVFRASPALRSALSTPFLSRWAFDVELLGRLLAGAPGVPPVPLEELVEVPLARWDHAHGSKLRPGQMIKAALELALVEHDLASRRRAGRSAG